MDYETYRVFANLERHRGDFPKATRTLRRDRREQGHRLVLERLSRHGSEPGARTRCTPRSTAAAPAPAARATSRAPTIHHVRWRRSSPTCTARNRRCCSPRAMCRTGPRSARWRQDARLRHPLRRAEPRLDDRGHPPFPRRKAIWKHNDVEDLDRKLRLDRPGRPKIVAFESVYSMDGDIAPIKEIARSARSMARSAISTRCTRSGCTGRAAAASPSARG
jgi:5-aminolevulinate synthase